MSEMLEATKQFLKEAEIEWSVLGPVKLHSGDNVLPGFVYTLRLQKMNSILYGTIRREEKTANFLYTETHSLKKGDPGLLIDILRQTLIDYVNNNNSTIGSFLRWFPQIDSEQSYINFQKEYWRIMENNMRLREMFSETQIGSLKLILDVWG